MPTTLCTTTQAFAPRSRTELKSALDNYAEPFEVHDVKGGGNCLFHSLSITESWADNSKLLQSPEPAVKKRAQELREIANDFLCPNGKPSEELLHGVPIELIINPEEGEDGPGYCARMRTDGEWGTAAEILALTIVEICVTEIGTTSPQPTPTPTTTAIVSAKAVGRCLKWCQYSSYSWSEKCAWHSGDCSTCPQCGE